LLEGAYAVSASVHHRGDVEMYDFHDRLYLFRIVNRVDNIHEKYGLMTLSGTWTHSAVG
jgi:lipopolysaccharide transport system ATP-binding protein